MPLRGGHGLGGHFPRTVLEGFRFGLKCPLRLDRPRRGFQHSELPGAFGPDFWSDLHLQRSRTAGPVPFTP
jgi:hypothetical protein